jgi:acyl-CoA synthetase (AMP-forming)/AMP-acid ligase II
VHRSAYPAKTSDWAADYRIPFRSAGVNTTVLFQFAEFGCIEDVALGLRWSPAEFAAQALSRANALAASDIKPGSIVVVARSGSAPFFADLFAVWTLGRTAACIDPTLTQGEIETLVEFVQPSAFLVGDVRIAAQINVPILELDHVAASPTTVPAFAGDPNDAALILFTSGTTGRPKGIVLSFQALLNRIALNRAAIGCASRMKTLVTLPTSFGHGLIGNALTPLLSGGDIVLHPLGQKLTRDLGRIVDEFDIGFLSSVPAFWRMALKFSAAPSKNSLARIHVGSAPLAPDLWARIAEWSRAEVVNCYGITELANWVAGASSRTDGIAEGLVGRPWGAQAAIKDSSGAICETGEGELVIKSPCVMSGYLQRPDLTAAVLVDGWYHTGDTGHIDKGGLIRLTGRIKDEINRAGFKVQPSEIDALLETHPAVSEACVFAIPDLVSGQIVAAAVCLAAGAKADAQSLRQWCATRLRHEAIPERWFIVDEIPRNKRGKINRDDVRQRLTKGPQ